MSSSPNRADSTNETMLSSPNRADSTNDAEEQGPNEEKSDLVQTNSQSAITLNEEPVASDVTIEFDLDYEASKEIITGMEFQHESSFIMYKALLQAAKTKIEAEYLEKKEPEERTEEEPDDKQFTNEYLEKKKPEERTEEEPDDKQFTNVDL